MACFAAQYTRTPGGNEFGQRIGRQFAIKSLPCQIFLCGLSHEFFFAAFCMAA
jgi:hypothetical protein